MIVFRRLLELPKYALAGMVGGLVVVAAGGYTVYVQTTAPHLSATVDVSPSPDISPTPDISPDPTPSPTIIPTVLPTVIPTVAPVAPIVAPVVLVPVIPSPIPSPIPIASAALSVSPSSGSNPLTVTVTANFLNMPASFPVRLTVNGLVCVGQVTGASISWNLILAPLADAQQQLGNYYDFVISSGSVSSSPVHVIVCPASGCVYSAVGPASTASIKC